MAGFFIKMTSNKSFNEKWLMREMRAHEIPDEERWQLLHMEHVETWKPHAFKYALKPALIILGFSVFILLLAQLWLWIFVPIGLSFLIFVGLYLNSPTYCRKCKKEMDYQQPKSLPGIKYDYCKTCRRYCNVRWVEPSGD